MDIYFIRNLTFFFANQLIQISQKQHFFGKKNGKVQSFGGLKIKCRPYQKINSGIYLKFCNHINIEFSYRVSYDWKQPIS